RGSIYHYWYDLTRYLRMPMFFAISGFLYAHRPVMPGKFVSFALGKARLLLIPFLSVATLQYLVRGLLPGVNVSTQLKDIWRIYFFGFDQFLFSQVALLTFLTVLLLEKFLPLPRRSKFPVYFLLAIPYSLLGPKSNFLSLTNFALMLPLFFLGCLLY